MKARGGIRVLLVDDHAMFREGLRAIIERMDDIEVVGEAAGVDDGVRLCAELKPSVVLMDVHFPDGSGVDATRTILSRAPATKVVALTMSRDESVVAQMVQAGAVGYIPKDSRAMEVVQAISTVAAGGAAIAPSVAAGVLRQYRNLANRESEALRLQLTDRDLAVLEGLAEGMGNQAIARRLSLSVQTVKNQLSGLYAKLGAANRTEAVVMATRLGLIKPS